jgi:hypothetical protein
MEQTKLDERIKKLTLQYETKKKNLIQMDIGKGGQNVSSRNKLDCPYHEIIIQ